MNRQNHDEETRVDVPPEPEIDVPPEPENELEAKLNELEAKLRGLEAMRRQFEESGDSVGREIEAMLIKLEAARRQKEELINRQKEELINLLGHFKESRNLLGHFKESRNRRVFKESISRLFSKDLVPSNDSRILVVGGFGAGKTSLVINLIQEDIPKERQSTDGIDVYFGKLLFDLKHGKLLKKKTGKHSFSKAVYQKVLAFVQQDQELETGGSNVNQHIGEQPVGDVIKELHHKIETSVEMDLQDAIPVPVLDFAGQIVYFATHQTFITSNGIYVIAFDGSKSLTDVLDDSYLKTGYSTILENIKSWVSSILGYCSPEMKDFPKILFVATHKDLIEPAELNNKRQVLLETLQDNLSDEHIQSHLILDRLFFINALDLDDKEMNELRECLAENIVRNPQWEKKVPKQFLVLETMIASLVEEGEFMMSYKDMEELNKKTGFEELSNAELNTFLHIQHLCGKLTYLDVPHLREFVLINPTCLIDVLKSIVTAAPVESELKKGRLSKANLSQIWGSQKFMQFKPYEEYFRELLVHYDVLSEVKRYDKDTGKSQTVESYLIPCMITAQNTTSYTKTHLAPHKCIHFFFNFKSYDIPLAIPNRMVACIISMWNIKNYENVDLLFPGFVVVSIDRRHDLVLQLGKTQLEIFLVHSEKKDLIIHDLASSVRECLEQNLIRISEVYSISFSDEINTRRYLPFETKFNQDANIWQTDRTLNVCRESCEGIGNSVLPMLLNDSQLLRIANSLTKEQVSLLAVQLGASQDRLEDLKDEHRLSSIVKFHSLRICRENNKRCCDFLKAMKTADIDIHWMCQIVRQKEVLTDLPDKILNLPPSDELIDKLSLRIGSEWMVLGLELGLELERLEQVEYDTPRVLREISRKMMYLWRNRDDKATIRELVEALGRAGRNPDLVCEILENCVSFPNIIPKDQE